MRSKIQGKKEAFKEPGHGASPAVLLDQLMMGFDAVEFFPLEG